jgi:hypothetical protein
MATQWVAAIDNDAGFGIEPAPEAQRRVCRQRFPLRRARNDRLALHHCYAAHGPSTLMTRPAIADATHSSVVAKTESTPSNPGP